jgi:hypothetical protein
MSELSKLDHMRHEILNVGSAGPTARLCGIESLGLLACRALETNSGGASCG